MLHKYSIVQNLKEPMKATEIAVDIVFISFEKFPRECLHRPRPATLLKKRLWRRCFPVNFVKFLRTPFLQNTSGRLLFSVKLLLLTWTALLLRTKLLPRISEHTQKQSL